MPLLLLVPALGVALWGGASLANAGNSLANKVTGTPEPVKPPVPSWVIPTVIIGVGGILLYKYGAKLLKV